jgi:HTH-type transcriptional regulator, sugar sensing transcriptional regulator
MAIAETLVPFGFTALESEIYVFLLRESPATGYRIAQGINKPAANTYKAIQGLQSKGAVLVEEGPSRLCRAVPLPELMGRLQKNFEERRKEAEKSLKALGKPVDDDRIYHLRSADQVLNRVREMIVGASIVALLKLPATIVDGLAPEMEEAAQRGISILLLTDVSTSVKGAEISVAPSPNPGQVLAVVDGLQTLLVAGLQTLLGIIGDTASAEAIWTQNPMLAQIHHAGLSAEIALANVATLLAADEKRSRILKAVEGRRPIP